MESGSGEWFYNTYLNDLEKIVKDAINILIGSNKQNLKNL